MFAIFSGSSKFTRLCRKFARFGQIFYQILPELPQNNSQNRAWVFFSFFFFRRIKIRQKLVNTYVEVVCSFKRWIAKFATQNLKNLKRLTERRNFAKLLHLKRSAKVCTVMRKYQNFGPEWSRSMQLRFFSPKDAYM